MMFERKTLLWLDDIRDPMDERWENWIEQNFGIRFQHIIWVDSYESFVNLIKERGLPDAVSFDHDLGDTSSDEKTGYDCCKYMVDYCIDNDKEFPMYRIQSDNAPGRENIDKYIQNFKRCYTK